MVKKCENRYFNKKRIRLIEDLRLKIFGISIRGSSHEDGDIPCQDACKYKIFDETKGVISIADGLGSAPHSDIGAQFCVQLAVDFIQKKYAETGLKDSLIENTVLLTMEEVRDGLIQFALGNSYNIHDLACTLIIVLIDGEKCAVCHIGDGAVVSSENTVISLISEPNNLEYRNEVIPITSDNWKEYVNVKQSSNFNSLAVFTDGLQDALMQKMERKWEINYDGFNFLFTWANSQTNEEDSIREIKRVLMDKFSLVSNDDKTLVISVR
jgi:serine/threonine protein phosphatase PrpC